MASSGLLHQHVILYHYVWTSCVHVGFTVQMAHRDARRGLFSWASASQPEPWGTWIWWSAVCLF